MPENEGFLAGREQVENYINALYTSLPAPTQYGMSVRGEDQRLPIQKVGTSGQHQPYKSSQYNYFLFHDVPL